MIINLGHGYCAIWKRGSHYINYFDNEGKNYHCVTFGWEDDETTQIKAWNAFYRAEMEMF